MKFNTTKHLKLETITLSLLASYLIKLIISQNELIKKDTNNSKFIRCQCEVAILLS